MVLAALAVLAVMQAAPSAQDTPIPPLMRKPQPRGRPQAWITDDDYPSGALRRREFGAVKFRLAVDALGKPTICSVTGSSGYSALDDKVCEMLLKRSVFNPARDGAGKDIPFDYNGTFTWILPGGTDTPNPVSAIASTPIDLRVELQAVPQNYAKPALLRLIFADDKVRACTVETSTGNAKLDAVACQQARVQVEMFKIDGAIIAKPDSRMVSVRFEAAK